MIYNNSTNQLWRTMFSHLRDIFGTFWLFVDCRDNFKSGSAAIAMQMSEERNRIIIKKNLNLIT